MAIGLRDATDDDLRGWDARAVDGPGGSVWQSLAWGEHATRAGWRVRHLVYDDSLPLLALERRWPAFPGGSAYLPRGPVSAGEAAERAVERLAAAANHLAASGIDVVASDAEIPASTGYPAALQAAGFRPIDEIHPSRNTMRASLEGGAGAAWERIAKTTRQRIGSARRRGLVVRRFDARTIPHDSDPAPTASARLPADLEGGVSAPPADRLEAAARAALGPFHGLLEETGTRRGFAIGSRDGAVAWWLAALTAGHLAYLEVRDVAPADDWERPAGTLLGGAILFRQGDRLTYGHSGDRADLRNAHPGVIHLVLWEAARIGADEGCAELDLGGVDVAGARGIPEPGDRMWGLYEFKRAFGGRWVEMTGAYERAIRPRRYAAGRAAAAVARRLRGVGDG
jgi:peptidoglycan pentaglycine glycine transferase (the first glycine)